MTWNTEEIVAEIHKRLQSQATPHDQLNYLRTYHTAAVSGFAERYAQRFPTAALLGMGGSGIVLKLTAPLQESAPGASPGPRCLKYPHPCIGLPGDFSLTDVLDNEATKLREISHPHIMQLDETVSADLPP